MSQPSNLDTDIHQISQFSSWLLDIGNGNIGSQDRNDSDNTNLIEIPHPILINSVNDGLETLIVFVYDYDIITNPSPEELYVRAIICPKNETINRVKSLINYVKDYW